MVAESEESFEDFGLDFIAFNKFDSLSTECPKNVTYFY